MQQDPVCLAGLPRKSAAEEACVSRFARYCKLVAVVFLVCVKRVRYWIKLCDRGRTPV